MEAIEDQTGEMWTRINQARWALIVCARWAERGGSFPGGGSGAGGGKGRCVEVWTKQVVDCGDTQSSNVGGVVGGWGPFRVLTPREVATS